MAEASTPTPATTRQRLVKRQLDVMRRQLDLMLRMPSRARVSDGALRPMSTAPAAVPATEPRPLPASISQREVWLTAQSDPDAATAHAGIGVWTLHGPLDPDRFEQALRAVSQRHEALRSTMDPDGETQLVQPDPAVEWRVSFPGGETAADELRPAVEWVTAELRRPMDLASGPLVRGRLARLSSDRHVLGLGFAPTAVDGWSFSVLLDEIAQLYNGLHSGVEVNLPAPPSYETYLEWERTGLSQARRYWAERFQTPPPPLDLPFRATEPSDDLTGETRSVEIGAGLYAGLSAVADRCGSTMFQLLLAGYAAFLHRITGEPDVVVGVPVAGQAMAGVPGLVGQCLRTLPVRSRTRTGMSFEDHLRSIRLALLEAQEHGAYSLGELLADTGVTRDQWGMGLISTVFNVDRPGHWQLSGLETSAVELSEQSATFDAAVNIREVPGAATVEWTYRRALFSAGAVDRLLAGFVRVLEAIAEDPARSLDLLPLRSDRARDHQVSAWSDGGPAEPVSAADCVHEAFARRSRETPEATALVSEGTEISYRELDARSDALAAHLSALGLAPDQPVGVYLPRSVPMVVAVLGILKAGGAYLPLDSAYPEERLSYLMEDSGVQYLLACRESTAEVPDFPGLTVWLDDDEPWWEQVDGTWRPGSVGPGNLAYLTYTSGSTGRPKGVAVEHGALANRIRWMQETYQLRAEDAVLQKTPLSFDVSGWELFWPLTRGARMVLAKPDGQGDADYLAELIESSGVTVLHFVPSMLAEFVKGEDVSARCRGVRQVFCSGEALTKELSERFFALFDCELHNLYGPTEATIDATFWPCEPGRAPVIGRPITGMSAYVLDDALSPVPTGMTGELYLGGVGLARAYWNRGGLTAERFVPDPMGDAGGRLYRTGDLARWSEDGLLEYLGRVDDQVKVRGFRVELGEVESALRRQSGVGEAVVVLRDERLVGYVVPARGASIDTGALREGLGAMLPPFMVPSVLVVLGRLPLLPNGKVNRKALPAPEATTARGGGEPELPRTDLERVVAEIWSEVLGVGSFGVHDNFFELGGDSIRALRVQSASRAKGLRIRMRDLFRNPTVAEIAAHLESAGVATTATAGATATATTATTTAAPGSRSSVAAGPRTSDGSEEFGLTPIQLWFFDMDLPNPSHWNHAILLTVTERVPPQVMECAVRAVARTHSALRTRFVRKGSRWRQRVAADDSIYEYVDMSGLPDADRAAALQAEKDRRHAALDIERGPVALVVHIHVGGSEPDQLLLIGHHLVTDVVSWQIVVADLQEAVRQASAGAPVSLPAPSTDYQTWADLLAASVSRPDIVAGKAFWTAANGRRLARLPVDHPAKRNVEQDARQVEVIVDGERTGRLIHTAARHGARPDRLVLAAVARALCEWSGENSILIDVETHGRHDLETDIDLSRTVGWFTSIVPVPLDAGSSRPTRHVVELVDEQLERMPADGLGYGILRYLSDDKRLSDELRALPSAEVLFNYLGSNEPASSGSLFAAANGSTGTWRDPGSPRSHLLEVNVMVRTGRLTLHLTYSGQQFESEKIRGFGDRLRNVLTEMIDEVVPAR